MTKAHAGLQINGAVDPTENRVSVKTIDLAAFMRQHHNDLAILTDSLVHHITRFPIK